MDFFLSCLYCTLIAIVLQAIVLRLCARHPAMWQRRNLLRLIAVVWSIMPVVKYCYIDHLVPPADSIEHEAVARDLADYLSAGRYGEVAQYVGFGNSAYQLMLGTFYYITHAPEIVTYAANGALGFVGLLFLLDVLCRHTHCRSLPLVTVLAIGLLPSALLWTTANLKEGLVLWGICAMLYLTVPLRTSAGRTPRILPIIGLVVVASQRPHIAAAWLAAIAAGAALDSKRIGLFITTTGAAIVSLALLSYCVPELFESAMGDGVSNTLADRYKSLSANNNLNGIALAGSNPIPVLSGLALIACRPWPFEVDNAVAALAGLEVWALAGIGLLNWKMSRLSWRQFLHPAMVTQLVALLALSFYFSYMYNMGLVVRQRLMCFPALLCLYVWPVLVRQSQRKPASNLAPVLDAPPANRLIRRAGPLVLHTRVPRRDASSTVSRIPKRP